MTEESPTTPSVLTFLDASFDPIGIVGPDGRYQWINEASVRLFGYTREEVLGSHFRDWLLPDEPVSGAMAQALHGSAAAVIRRVRVKDGTFMVLRTELIPLGDGRVAIHASDLTALYDLLQAHGGA
ncbi:MAG: PAS domain-containing protein [Chloroflexota bacterium]